MPCACQRCLQHAKILGFAPKPPTQAVVRRAFRAAAKLWHPDRFEKMPVKRAEAEEHFKGIQVAYRELLEHCEAPVELWPKRAAAQPSDRANGPVRSETAGTTQSEEGFALSFGGAPYCFVAPHFSPYANEIILASRLENAEKVLAFVDVSGASRGASRGEYILLTSYRIFVRDALNISSFLWFIDLGDVLFVDRNKHGKPRIWQWILELFPDIEPRFSLQIYRRNRTLLYSLGGTDDRVKKVIYNFLLQKKSQTRS
ncbi:MAG: J domain-containing protein [Terracidiphilus sp.]